MAAEHRRAMGHVEPERWAEAADLLQAQDHVLDAAIARWREAEAWLLQGSERARAARALAASHEVAERLGSRPLLSWIDELARRARLRLPALDAVVSEEPAHPGIDLTPREREVLALLAAGRSNAEIADELFISGKTVSVHLSNIKGKLGAPNRVAMATIGLRMGLVAEVG